MLTTHQRKKLRNALISAFPSQSAFEELLYFEPGKNLNEITSNDNLQNIAFRLIQISESQGWLGNLIQAACKNNPGNLDLQGIAQELLINQITSSTSHGMSTRQDTQLHPSSSANSIQESHPNFISQEKSDKERLNVSKLDKIDIISRSYSDTLSQFGLILPDPGFIISNISEVDYTLLERLLENGNWQAANLQTTAIVLKISGREQQGQLEAEDLKKFPHQDLERID